MSFAGQPPLQTSPATLMRGPALNVLIGYETTFGAALQSLTSGAVAELADAADSKSAGDHSPSRFDPEQRHHL